MIALIDYGAGNLTSVRKALAALGADFTVPATPEALARVGGIIVPGVGHFEATRSLDSAWRDAIRAASDRGTALLGICLGMQWFYEGSDEAPSLPGLGLFAGRCFRLPERARTGGTEALKVPHVGWNSVSDLSPHATLMRDVDEGAHVYFTHSFAAPVTADTVASTTHGCAFAAAVERGRIAGVQFHPEKSGDAGLRMLRNWLSHAL